MHKENNAVAAKKNSNLEKHSHVRRTNDEFNIESFLSAQRIFIVVRVSQGTQERKIFELKS